MGILDWLGRSRGTGAVRSGDDDLFGDDFQRKLEVLSIVSRRIYAGRLRAERRSKKTGSGIEFADHREYSPGDDFRYLDWTVYGRSGRLLLRLFEEEEDLSVYVLVDRSRSMEGGNPRKIDQARRLAAGLAYVALANLDRVSIVGFSDHVEGRLPPTRGKNRIFKVFQFLRGVQADGATSLAEATKSFVAQTKRRGVVLLLSDLYDPAGFEQGINTLRYHKHEPYVLQVYDPSEVNPALHGDVQLVDVETGESRELTVTPRILAKYAEAHRAYRERVERFCTTKQVSYAQISTAEPFDDAILRLLRKSGGVG